MNFLYNFLFVVYFHSNKIWCIEKLVLQYKIKSIDFTGMSISHNSHFPTLIIFKMNDDGSALRVGAKHKSLTDLECALKNFQQDNYVQLYKRISMKLGTGSKYKNMEAAESAAGLLIYKELDYSCIHGRKIVSSISSGQRSNTR